MAVVESCGKGHERSVQNTRRWVDKSGVLHLICKICSSDASRAWYAANKERKLTTTKAWHKANPKKQSLITKRWRAANSEQVNAYNHARRVSSAFPKHSWKELLELFNGWCPYCGESGKKLTVDHVIPYSKGGTNSIDNLIPCCGSCNSKKHTKDLTDWANNL